MRNNFLFRCLVLSLSIVLVPPPVSAQDVLRNTIEGKVETGLEENLQTQSTHLNPPAPSSLSSHAEPSASLSGLEEPKPEQIWQLVQTAKKFPLLGEGYAIRVYPFPGNPNLVIKIPKTYSHTFQAMWKAGRLPISPLAARRITRDHLASYRWAQERGKGIFIQFRVYELPYHRLPYVVIQQRGEALVGQELRALDFSTPSGMVRAQGILTENLDLRWRALAQGIWESVDNFTVNNMYVVEDGRRVQRIADAGEVKIVPPTPEERNRIQQLSVTRDLPAIHPGLAPWYLQQVLERFRRLSDKETAQIWSSQGPRAMDFQEANEAIRVFSSSAGLEEIPLAPGLTTRKVIFITPEMASPQLFKSLKTFKPAPGEQLPLAVFAEHDFHVEEIQGWLN